MKFNKVKAWRILDVNIFYEFYFDGKIPVKVTIKKSYLVTALFTDN